jgi:hypothetical protein
VNIRDERSQRDVAQAATCGDCNISLDHLVGAGEECRWHVNAKNLRGFEIDHEIK